MATKRPYGTGAKLIELKSGYAIRWFERVVDEDGTTRRIAKYEHLGAIAKIDAESRRAEHMMKARRAGAQPLIQIPTFAEHAARYERDLLGDPMIDASGVHADATFKFSTRYGRKGTLQKHLIPRFGPTLVSNITTADVQRFMRELQEAGYDNKSGRQFYSAHTLHDIREVMRVVMNASIQWYRQPVDPLTGQPFNPVVGIQLPKLKRKHKPWSPTPENVGRLIRILRGKAKAMVALAITCGMRRGELLGFRLEHLTVVNDSRGRFGVIRICEASYLGRFDTPKTEAGERKLYVHPWVLGLIENWTQRSKKRHPRDLVFGTRTNRVENSNNILRRHIYPACDAIGVPHASWLTFRRTFKTWADEERIDPRTIADLMGHADVETQSIYAAPSDEMKWVAADRVGGKLCKIVEIFDTESALVH